MTGKYSYITVLSTDSYVAGVIVLYRSLVRAKVRYPFVVLTTPNLAAETLELLRQNQIDYLPIAPIEMQTDVSERQQHWQWTYSKLQIFNQTQFEKLVYLDADMLVYQNIDSLFDKPHMSAVNAGACLPQYSHWTELNSGLMVIEPSSQLYADMLAQLPQLYQPAGGDQDFLNAYYPNWPKRSECHLDHGYNLFHTHIDQYQQLSGQQLNSPQSVAADMAVKVVHFIGEHKPWLIQAEIIQHRQARLSQTVKYGVSYLVRMLRKQLPKSISQRLPAAIGTRLKQRALQHWLEIYQDGASELSLK